MRVCVWRLPLTSGVMWHDMVDSIWWILNKLNNFYIADVVGMVSGCGLSIEVHHRNQPNKS